MEKNNITIMTTTIGGVLYKNGKITELDLIFFFTLTAHFLECLCDGVCVGVCSELKKTNN